VPEDDAATVEPASSNQRDGSGMPAADDLDWWCARALEAATRRL
jgi:hypothetical protein